MIRKRVLGVGVTSATMLVEDTENDGMLRVLKRINVSTWNTKDVTKAYEMYKLLSESNIPHMVDLHKVLLQNSFLSLVTSYSAGGNIETYLEEKKIAALDESTAVRWLLVVATVLQQTQRLSSDLCFYGLELKHVFLSDNARDISVGLPVPRISYFRRLADRESNKVAVDLEYPPEVTKRNQYYMGASDVWHLGLIGMKIITAHASLSQRSHGIRNCILSMMDADVEKRPRIHDVVRILTGLLGNSNYLPHLQQNRIPSLSLTQCVSSLSPEGVTRATATGAGDVNGDEKNRMVERGATLTQEGVLRSARHRLPQSWHRRAMEQFEELQRLNISPPRARSRGTSPCGRRWDSTSAERRSSQWQLHTSDTLNAHGRTSAVSSPRGGRGLASQRRHRSSGGSSSDGGEVNTVTNVMHQMLNQELEQQRKREMLRHDYDEKRWKQMEKERLAQDVHRNHMDKLRNIRRKRSEENKRDIQKHIKQWKQTRRSSSDANVIVSEQNGISVFVPKNTPMRRQTTSSASSPTRGKQGSQISVTPSRGSKDYGIVEIEKNGNTSTDSTNMREEEQTEASIQPQLRPLTVPPRRPTPPSVAPTRCASVFLERGIGPDVPVTRAYSTETVSLAGSRFSASGANFKLFSVQSGNSNEVSTINGMNGETLTIPQALLGTPASCDVSVSRGNENEQCTSNKTATFGRRGDVNLMSTIEISKTSLRNSLVKLLANRKLYLEAMDVVRAFGYLSETERHNPQRNVVFMNALRKVFSDEKLFTAAGPMCAQLVALQGLS